MITTPEALRALVDRARRAERVALDTEFVWERTYFPRLGLIQLALAEDDVHLIDPVALDDLSPLGALLRDASVVKILHDAQQDLQILRRATGAYPTNVFDTQRAGGFVGLGASVSLADLLRALVDVHLPKTHTRTDWVRRPLSEQQLDYAEDDVRYMPRAYDLLRAKAEARGRLAWLDEEMAAYEDPALYDEKDPEEQFLRLGGIGRLDAQRRAVVQALAAWREREARRQDRPRSHVVPDSILVQVAKRLPRQPQHLAKIKGKFERERYQDALLEAVRRGLDVAPDDTPDRKPSPQIDEVDNARIDFALAYLKGKCLGEGVDPQLLANRADLTAVVLEGADAEHDHHPILQGWRGDFLGRELLQLLQGRHAVRLDPDTRLPILE